MNLKTRRGAYKRLRIVGKKSSLKIKARHACMRHKLLSKSMNAKRDDRLSLYLASGDRKRVLKFHLAA